MTRLCDLSSEGNAVTSVAWSERGHLVAVGTQKGHISVWDVTENKEVRFVFIASRCITHIELWVEGTWAATVKTLHFQTFRFPTFRRILSTLRFEWRNSTPLRLVSKREEIEILNISFRLVQLIFIVCYVCI